MKRPKSETFNSNNSNNNNNNNGVVVVVGKKLKLSHFLSCLAALYLIFIYFKFPHFLEIATSLSNGADDHQDVVVEDLHFRHRMLEDSNVGHNIKPVEFKYGRITGEIMRRMDDVGLSSLEGMAKEAWSLGRIAWKEVENVSDTDEVGFSDGRREGEACPSSVQVSGKDVDVGGSEGEHLMFLPCGLAAGSSITFIGTPHHAHYEYVPQLAKLRHGSARVLVSQFMVELQGLKSVDGEDPPRILHLNPRLRGDWSNRPVIEHNTCYRMQWGTGQRCDGIPSKHDDDQLVDGFRKCEKWTRSDIVGSRESKTTSWFKRFIGREQKPQVTWPFAFAEGRMFVLTLRAGVEGYHISVGGRHVTSFPYRTGFILEDATGLAIKGDVDVHYVYATSLPVSHPSFSLQQVLEMSKIWKANPLPSTQVRLFIGVLSATNHFAERMAVRKTWMQSAAVKSSNVVVRFFVALSSRKEVNAVLKKEAAYFGDVVILPFMDHYELVVLKTIAICEYGVHTLTASYIMKCDDDTFVRVDTVLKEIDGIPPKKSLYMGNLNLLHRPLRNGKWAVTYEEWPEEVYPPYANGPGYVISIDIAKFIISQRAKQSLRLFKMEDVSMGMWVEQFNSSTSVQYSHNWKFCQYGCMEDYYTAHYQSPRQMLCLWDKLARGRAHCCNFR